MPAGGHGQLAAAVARVARGGGAGAQRHAARRRPARRSRAGSPCSPRRATPLEPLEPPDGLPWPERASPSRSADSRSSTSTRRSRRRRACAKVLTHEALYAYAARARRRRSSSCGDLNTPRRDHEDGTVLTFAHDTKGRVRAERGERWVAAERALVYTLRDRARLDRRVPRRARAHVDSIPATRGGWRLDHMLDKGVEVARPRLRARVAAQRPQRPLRRRRPTLRPATPDELLVDELVEAVAPELVAVAGVLDAAERQLGALGAARR